MHQMHNKGGGAATNKSCETKMHRLMWIQTNMQVAVRRIVYFEQSFEKDVKIFSTIYR